MIGLTLNVVRILILLSDTLSEEHHSIAFLERKGFLSRERLTNSNGQEKGRNIAGGISHWCVRRVKVSGDWNGYCN